MTSNYIFQWIQTQTNRLQKLQACLKDIQAWMTRNVIQLKTDKAEVIRGPKHLRNMLLALAGPH